MSLLLLQHAVKNIWCEPVQDYQTVMGLARLTVNAVSRTCNVLWGSIKLPQIANSLRGLFHVYQIGALPPSFFNLSLPAEEWVLGSEVVEQFSVVIDIFFRNGARVPTDYFYLRKNKDNNIILAVRYLPNTDYFGASLDTDKLYARFYSNAYYDSNEYRSQTNLTSPVKWIHATINTAGDLAQFNINKASLISQYSSGAGLLFIDGYLITGNPSFDNSLVGKHFSFCYDASIKRQVFFPLATTPTFISVKDINVVKYLMITDATYQTVDYYDDIDAYAQFTINGVTKSIYLGRLRAELIRQVTHNTYSMSKRAIEEFIAFHGLNVNDITVRLVVRQGGFLKGLIPQHNRVEELYKLSYSQIVEAMTTVTPIPEWNAAALENSDYINYMDLEQGAVYSNATQQMVENAYGYNAATKALANPICRVLGTVAPYVEVPLITTTPDAVTGNGRRVLYFYKDGKLQGFVNDSSKNVFYYLPPAYDDCDFVEVFNATNSGIQTSTIYDSDVTSEYLKQYGFRCYVSPMIGGVPTEDWYDVTDGPYHYYEENGNALNGNVPTLSWNYPLLSAANLFPCVKLNHLHYWYTPPALTPGFNGLIQFDLLEQTLWFGSTVTKALKLPFGVIDVFMNGYSLVRDLDYFVEDNQITIIKRPDTSPEDTVIWVRGYGVCDPNAMATDTPREFDFVKGGILSINGIYNIRNDRNIRTVVSGRVKLRDEVRFAEDMSGALTADGRPYAINDYAVAVENFTSAKFIPYRAQAIDLDNRVMDYLTARLTETTVLHPIIEVEKWDVFSPFLSRIIHALMGGFLGAGELDGVYTDAQVDTWISAYLPLLAVDPCLRNIDLRYVLILAHPYHTLVSVTSSQYRFLQYLINRFLLGRVDLTPTVIIG